MPRVSPASALSATSARLCLPSIPVGHCACRLGWEEELLGEDEPSDEEDSSALDEPSEEVEEGSAGPSSGVRRYARPCRHCGGR